MPTPPNRSAADHLGPHLLGRTPPHPDRQRGDWDAARFLAGDDLDVALAALEADKHAALVTRLFGLAAAAHLRKLEAAGVIPPPLPPPPLPSTAVIWPDPDATLDQGQTPRCVGFSGAQRCNIGSVNEKYGNSDGDALYAECKVIDGEPGAQDGSSLHSGATALVNRGRVQAYAWASTLPVLKAWLLSKGPVWIGADWYNEMFTPDALGFVTPTGGKAGGHAFNSDEYDPATDTFGFKNNWGTWGLPGGRFRMKGADFGKLVSAAGFEGCVFLELPV